MIIGTVSLGGNAGRLLLGLRLADVAVLLGHDAQCLTDRRAVALGLDQRRGHGFDAGDAGALAEILEGLAAVLQVGQLGGRQAQLFGELQRLARNFLGDFTEGRPRPTCPTARR